MGFTTATFLELSYFEHLLDVQFGKIFFLMITYISNTSTKINLTGVSKPALPLRMSNVFNFVLFYKHYYYKQILY